MSGGVPKRISISRTQANTYCKSGGKNKVPGLVLCSRGRSRTAMCNYIKKRTNTKLSPYVKFVATGATMRVDGEYTIYDFTSNGQLTLEQVTVDEANSSKRCGPPTIGKIQNIEYFMVGGGGAGARNGGDTGGGGAGGVVKTSSIPLNLKQILNIEVGLGGIAQVGAGVIPVQGLPGGASNLSYLGIIATATGGKGGNPESVGTPPGAGGDNADHNGGTQTPAGTQSGGGAGSAGDGFTFNFGPAADPASCANGGPGTSIPAKYGITGILGPGGGAGGPYVYPQVASAPPPFFGFGGAHIGTEGPGDGGGAVFLSNPASGTTADFKETKAGADGFGGGGGGCGVTQSTPGNGGSGRVLIRFKHL